MPNLAQIFSQSNQNYNKSNFLTTSRVGNDNIQVITKRKNFELKPNYAILKQQFLVFGVLS